MTNLSMVGTMMTKRNYMLPSLVCPIILNIYFILINQNYNFTIILGGFFLYSFFTFPFVNLFGWPCYFFMVTIQQDNYIVSGLLGGFIGGLIFLLLAPSRHAYFSIEILYFIFSGVMTGVLFRFLVYYRIDRVG